MLGPTAMSKPPTGTLASASRDHRRRCIRLLRRYEMRLFSALFSLRHVACAGRRRRQVLGGLALVATVTIAFLTALVLNPFGSHTQNANVTISFDMVPAGND